MLKKIFKLIVVCIFLVGTNSYSFAMMCAGEHSQHSGQAQAKEGETKEHEHTKPESVTQVSPSVNVGNKICPVSDEKIDERMKATYEYEGKIYNFCCPACIEEFKKDPQRYIEKVEEELKSTSQEESGAAESPMHEGH